MNKTVCFTGHREISAADYAPLEERLAAAVEEQIRDGALCFRAGGALGFDTMAALCVLKLRARYPDVRLELILPCPTQDRAWSKNDRELYRQILERADEVRYVSPVYFSGVLQLRNRTLVQDADVCISYLRTSRGGTAHTVATALGAGLEWINLAP